MARHAVRVDLHLVLRRENKILLGKRINTGFYDGSWHLPSGHGEAGESGTTGVAREAGEELGIGIDPAAVRLLHLMHHHTDSDRLALFFEATAWTGEPTNTEPDKCAGWEWFALDDLPWDQMIPYAREALLNCVKGELYSERGWN